MNEIQKREDSLFERISVLIEKARKRVVTTVNIAEVYTKYSIGQYIVEDEENLQISKFECEYRATRRAEMTKYLLVHGCSEVKWKFPEETGFYQPIVIAKK